MKNIILFFALIIGMITTTNSFANNPEGFENVLIIENYTAGNDVFQQALENLSITDYTSAYNGLDFPDDIDDFEDQIDSNHDGVYDGDWDLIIVNYDNALSATVLNLLNEYLLNGGYLIFTYQLVVNFTSHPIWANLGFTPIAGPPLVDPISFTATDSSHLFFNNPNTIGTTFNSPDDLYAFYGYKLDVSDDAVQVANISGNVDEGLIIINNDEKGVFNSIQLMSFTNDDDADGKADNIELAENEISFLTMSSAAVSESINIGISVYPNPTTGLLNISSRTHFKLEIIDLTGKTISDDTYNAQAIISIKNPGMYFLRFTNDIGTKVEKIIVRP